MHTIHGNGTPNYKMTIVTQNYPGIASEENNFINFRREKIHIVCIQEMKVSRKDDFRINELFEMEECHKFVLISSVTMGSSRGMALLIYVEHPNLIYDHTGPLN